MDKKQLEYFLNLFEEGECFEIMSNSDCEGIREIIVKIPIYKVRDKIKENSR